MITDFFSHKIHASRNDWPDKLVELACLFAEFDGSVFDRNELEARLVQISPRSAFAPRDRSKFRDEISAYPAYLGLYRLQQSPEGWKICLSETAKRFLVTDEPDVSAFLRLQLLLFQYPNGMGGVYTPKTNNLHLQHNPRDKTLEFIAKGMIVSPLRLVCASILADSKLRGVDLWNASVTSPELYALANHPDVYRSIQPDAKVMSLRLKEVREGVILPPDRYETRFHILRHTDLFSVSGKRLGFRKPQTVTDREDLRAKIAAISNTDVMFTGFSHVSNSTDLLTAIARGDWGRYLDGIATLNGKTIQILAHDIIVSSTTSDITQIHGGKPISTKTYHLKERSNSQVAPPPLYKKTELADPEVTRIKRQRRNLTHKILVDKMDELLRRFNAIPRENPHIDLYADIPGDGSFLFEIKSGGENLLDQIRKGISQLYEYRFRYRKVIATETALCLVTKEEPVSPPWMQEYLIRDRGIAVCWFADDGSLQFPKGCEKHLGPLAKGIPNG